LPGIDLTKALHGQFASLLLNGCLKSPTRVVVALILFRINISPEIDRGGHGKVVQRLLDLMFSDALATLDYLCFQTIANRNHIE
jgi:hypothetical protein